MVTKVVKMNYRKNYVFEYAVRCSISVRVCIAVSERRYHENRHECLRFWGVNSEPCKSDILLVVLLWEILDLLAAAFEMDKLNKVPLIGY